MSFNVAMLEALQAEGLDLAACIRVLRAGEKKSDPTAAERKRRQRGKSRVTSRRDPPNDNILTPEVSEAEASSPQTLWACPVGVEADHWRDLLKNRKTKRLTNSETAYRDLLNDLDRISDDEWPPGRLVKHAAAKGWGAIYDPRKSKNGPNSTIGKSAAAFAELTRHYGDHDSF
jgi:hypothetical protein